MDEEENQEQPEEEISDQKMARLRNLKAFKGWSDQQIKEYMKTRPKKVPKLFSSEDAAPEADISFDEKEYEKKFVEYRRKYHKEYGVDMNDANDRQQLDALVRYVIQSEMVDKTIIKMQSGRVDARTLKALGDFQRTVQASITELQGTLGISRKQRKEKQADDVPQYIRGLQVKAKDYWARTTTSVRCPRCQVEVARYWLNFPKNVKRINLEAKCTKCEEEVIYSV